MRLSDFGKERYASSNRSSSNSREGSMKVDTAITGMPDLDSILKSRDLDISAKKLKNLLTKRAMDGKTVWQGLPGILSTFLGGGLRNTKYSWYDAVRSSKPPIIRSNTLIQIYSATKEETLRLIFENASKISQCPPNLFNFHGDALRFWEKPRKKHQTLTAKHDTTLILGTTVGKNLFSDCSLFNVIFNASMNPEYCTYQYDVNQLPRGIKYAISMKLKGSNVPIHDPYDVYSDILHRTEIDRQNRYDGMTVNMNGSDLNLIVTPAEYFLFSFFHYPVSKDRGAHSKDSLRIFRRGISTKSMSSKNNIGVPMNGKVKYSNSISDFNADFDTNDINSNKNKTMKVTALNHSSTSAWSSNSPTKLSSRNAATDKRNSPDYLAYAPLREIINDDEYMLLVHQYCEFFMPLEQLYPTHEEVMFVNILVEFWLKQTIRNRSDISGVTGYTDLNSGQMYGLSTLFRPTRDQVIGLLIFITHVHLRDQNSLYQYDAHRMSVVEPAMDETYGVDLHLMHGTSRTMHRIQSSMYNFFCHALVHSDHRKASAPIFSMVVDLWLAYCQPWNAAKRTCEKPRTAGMHHSDLGKDISAINRTGLKGNRRKMGKGGVRGDMRARESARKNDPVTKGWVSYVVHNYFFYIEMLTLIMKRSTKFEYSSHGTGELDLIERVLAMYTPNLRAILEQCQLRLEISLSNNRSEVNSAKDKLDLLESNGKLLVGHEFSNILNIQFSDIGPDDMHGVFERKLPNLGKEIINYITNELNNENEKNNSSSSSFVKQMKDWYHGKKGKIGLTEPSRDLNGFITNTGRGKLLDSACNAVYWNNCYGPQNNTYPFPLMICFRNQHPCSFMKEVKSEDRSVLRLVPHDTMLAPVTRYEIRPLVWFLVYISEAINNLFKVKRAWNEFIHISGDACNDGGKWYPIDIEDNILSIKKTLKKKYNIRKSDQDLFKIKDDGDGEYDEEDRLDVDEDRFVDYSIHHGNKLILVDRSKSSNTGEIKEQDKRNMNMNNEQMFVGQDDVEDKNHQLVEKNNDDDDVTSDGLNGHNKEDVDDANYIYGSNDRLGPWGEELPRGAWGTGSSGNAASDITAYLLKNPQQNLNYEPRMNRVQRMIHLLFNVKGKSPERFSESNQKKFNQNNVTSSKVEKEQGIKKLPKPKWVVYNPIFGGALLIERVNLRFLASIWNIIICILIVVGWKYYHPDESVPKSDGTEQVGTM